MAYRESDSQFEDHRIVGVELGISAIQSRAQPAQFYDQWQVQVLARSRSNSVTTIRLAQAVHKRQEGCDCVNVATLQN